MADVPRRPRLSRYGRLAIWPAGAAFGILSLTIARVDPGGSFAGSSTQDGILELGAGWGLMLTGLLFWARRPRNRFGPLLTAAAFAWFLPEWSNSGVGERGAFTLGLVGFAACPPLIAHAALCYPGGRLGSALDRILLAFAYVGALGFLGLLPTAVYDPAAEGCLQCPRNLALTHGDSGAVEFINRWGLRLGLVWAVALVALMAWRLVRAASAGRGVVVPVLVAAGAYLAVVAWDFRHSLGRGVLSNDPVDVRLWRYEAVALGAIALGVAWGLYRARQARTSVARLVVELAHAPGPGGVRDALAQALGDDALQLAYRRTADESYVDADGRPVEVEAGPGRAITPLQTGGRPIGALVHDAALLQDSGLIEEVVSAARLAVENERLQAEVRAQLQSLRASRSRIVETGDRERRRLERDLHDGAQQRLVGLSLVLRMARGQLASDPAGLARLDEADAELRAALAELRELAHGIYPAVLADEGLAAAVETLAEGSPVPIELAQLPEERFEAAVESAAYFVLAETVKRANATWARVGASRDNGKLVVEIESDGELDDELTDLEDRVGAIDGRLGVERADGRLRVRAELPCAS